MYKKLILIIFSLCIALQFDINFASGAPTQTTQWDESNVLFGTPSANIYPPLQPQQVNQDQANPSAVPVEGWGQWWNNIKGSVSQGVSNVQDFARQGLGLARKTKNDVTSAVGQARSSALEYGQQRASSAQTYTRQRVEEAGQAISSRAHSAGRGLERVGTYVGEKASRLGEGAQTIGSYPLGATALIAGGLKVILGAAMGFEIPDFTALMTSNILFATAAIELILGTYNGYNQNSMEKKLIIKSIIGMALSDGFTYPTRSSKINALMKNEFLTDRETEGGIVAQVYKELIDEINATPFTAEEKKEEFELGAVIEKYRRGLSALSLEEQIENLQSDEAVKKFYEVCQDKDIRAKISILHRLTKQKILKNNKPADFEQNAIKAPTRETLQKRTQRVNTQRRKEEPPTGESALIQLRKEQYQNDEELQDQGLLRDYTK